eukprot:s1194_g15.t1
MADYVGDAYVYYKGAGEEDPILTFAFHTKNHQLLLDVSGDSADAKKENFRKRYERELSKVQDKYKDLEPEFSDDDMNATLEEVDRKRGWQYPLTKTQQKKEFGCVPAEQQRFLWRLQDGHLDIVEDYLGNPKMKKAIDLNRYDDEGLTPLHHAAKLGHADIVKALIEGKADPLLRDKVNGLTALDLAVAGRWDSGPHADAARAIQDLELTRQSLVPLCASWHLGLADANFQCGGSSGSTALPRPSDTPADETESREAEGVKSCLSGTLRCAVWASLACLRQHFLTGATGVPSQDKKEEVPWSDLGQLLVPSSSIRSGLGPCARLTCPTYFGEAAGSELQQDVLVAIMGFIYGVEAEVRDIGVFADAPPVWLREEQESVKSEVADKLNWEAFLDALGMKPLSPCTLHRKVAGTVLTIDLGWRLSSCDWWRAVCASSTALNYIELRLKNADRVELTWLRQLRTPERVDVSELFLRSTYVRYGGHFLPYMDMEETEALSCLQRLQVATELNGPGLRKCLRVLQLRRCHDISVFADLYAALQALPKAEQSSTNSWGSENPQQFQVFLPPSNFEIAQKCLWTDDGCSCLRWLCGYHVLLSEYGRFGSACRSWLLGPHVGVRQDLNSLEGRANRLTQQLFFGSCSSTKGHCFKTDGEM